jgi:hypothetical protein
VKNILTIQFVLFHIFFVIVLKTSVVLLVLPHPSTRTLDKIAVYSTRKKPRKIVLLFFIEQIVLTMQFVSVHDAHLRKVIVKTPTKSPQAIPETQPIFAFCK